MYPLLFNTLHHRAIPFRRSARRSYPMPALFPSIPCQGRAIQCYSLAMPDSAMPVYAFAVLCNPIACLCASLLCRCGADFALPSLHPASPCGTIPLLFSAYQFSSQPIHCQRCWTQLRRCVTLQTQPCFSFAFVALPRLADARLCFTEPYFAFASHSSAFVALAQPRLTELFHCCTFQRSATPLL